jgi:hypothetical protein
MEKKQYGGYRLGAGRKPKYGTKTVVMRIPEDRVQEVQNLIGGDGLESVTESKHEILIESGANRGHEVHHRAMGGAAKAPSGH